MPCSAGRQALPSKTPTRSFARIVGGVLTAAGAGSEPLADSHAVAAAIETDGGLALTSDVADLERLAAPYPNVQISKV